MARGDLSARPQALGGDEVAETLQAMATSLARLSGLLASVRHGVGAITQAWEQMADDAGLSMARADGHVDVIHAAMREVAALTQQGDPAGRP